MTVPSDLPDWIAEVGGSSRFLFQGFVAASPGNSVKVSQYNSVHILLGNTDGTSSLVIAYQFMDSQTGFAIDSGLLTADANRSVSGDGFATWDLPVVADTLILLNTTGHSVIGVVIGRPERVPKGMANAYYPSRHFQANMPASSPNGTRIQLLGDAGNNPVPVFEHCSSYNGQCTLFLFSSGAISGQVQAGFLDKTGTRVFVPVAANATTTGALTVFGHPYAYCTWWFQAFGVSPASSVAVSVTVTPAGVDG